MCRPFKRPRPPSEQEANGDLHDGKRVVRSRLNHPSASDATMPPSASDATMPPSASDATMPDAPTTSTADAEECISKPSSQSMGRQQTDGPSSQSAVHEQHTNGVDHDKAQRDEHGEAIWSADEVPPSNGHGLSNGHAHGNGQASLESSPNGFDSDHIASSGDVRERSDGGALQQSSDVEQKGTPLKRMSWMQDGPVAGNGTAVRPEAATNGHAAPLSDAGDGAPADTFEEDRIGDTSSPKGAPVQ